MEALSKVDELLKNLTNLHELGRQRAFELGNPYYSERNADGGYLRKELPTGEIFLALVDYKYDENGYPVEVIDTYLAPINEHP
ncbi:hypothetical protein [Desertivirga brevis]|uniref:hypothetical protein n=1 Tax=Desertivirga brevis TaxID=2810310 RepID=UPI001A971460|nr:hypothetical protein [Pedobacter sp. SYSU D00873]